MASKQCSRSFGQFFTPVLLVAPLLVLNACGSAPTTSQAPTATTNPASNSANPEGKAARFALIMNGPPTDKSWNQKAYEAAQALKSKGMDVVVSESISPADVERVLRQYVEAGYSPIVAHSFNFGGKLSKTGKLGALYGFDIPVCHAMGEAMLAGAKTVRPDATLTDAAVGNWDDVAKAKEAALSQAETGVDFWIGCGQGPTLGQIEAAKAKGGFATSYVGDMS